MRQQRASKVHEDRYHSSHPHGTLERRGKDEFVKPDMLDPPRYLQRLSFGILDRQQLEKRKDTAPEGTKGACSSYASSYSGSVETAASSLELDLATGVVKRLELDGRQDGVQGQCSSPVNVIERNQDSLEKPCLPVTSKKGRHASPPNRRFSFSFSQLGRSFSTKESSSSGPALSNTSHASAKSGPLTFNDSTITKPKNGHNGTRSGPILKPKTDKNVPLQAPSKPQKNQCSSRSHALLQFTLRKGISLYQFVVENNNNNNVVAATMKSSGSSRKSYTLYSIKEVKNKSGNWLGRHKNDHHPFVHNIIGQMKTNFDSATHKSDSVLFGVETKEELAAAIVQTRNRTQKQNTTTVVLPSGIHTLPKDGNAPLPLLDRWKSGGSCDCGGWDIGCKLRVLSNDHHTKSQSSSSFQMFDDHERDEAVFKMVTHDNELHSVEFGSSVSILEAFFIALAASSHQNWCEEEEEEEAGLIRSGTLNRVTSAKYASNPPVSPIGRV